MFKKIFQFPDFKHKSTNKGLLPDNWRKPPCVKANIATTAHSFVQSGGGLRSPYGLNGSMDYEQNRVVGNDNSFSIAVDVSKLCQEGHLKEALQIVDLMVQQGCNTSIDTYACLLQGCIRIKALAEGKQVHAHIIRSGFELDIFLGNTLIEMYANCGCVLNAHRVFNKMPEHNLCSWTYIISAYAKQGQGKEVFILFQQMLLAGVAPDKVVFIAVLKACASLAALERGRQVHAHIIRSGFESDNFVKCTLVHMYAKCGSIEDARKVFRKMKKRNVVSWTAMIAGCSQQGHGEDALALFEQMQHEGVKPNNVTFVSVLKACAGLAALERGKQVHAQVVKSGFGLDIYVGNTLIDMYAKCKSIEDGRQVFNKMHERDVVSWNAIISGYAQLGLGKEALALFEQMQQEGMNPDEVTFVGILKACASLAALERGKQIHAQIIKSGFESDAFVESTLVDMYVKCGSMENARLVFKNIRERNVVSWTAMIAGYAQQGFGDKALTLFAQMQQEGVKPNNVTFVSILKACAIPIALKWGKQVHAHVIKSNFESDVLVGNALVDMYVKCGSIGDARQVFNNMCERNVVSWNTMIAGYAQQGLGKEALILFEEMQREGMKPNNVTFVSILKACARLAALERGKEIHAYLTSCGFESDVFVANTLVDMYAKCGSLQDAREVFNKMIERSVVSWNIMIAGYAHKGHGKEALALFEQMELGCIEPDQVTFLSILKACASLTALKRGKQVHAHIIRSGFASDVCVRSSLVDMYAKCGSIEDAQHVFNQMHERNVILWNAMIAGYAQQGLGMEVLTLFEQMQREGLKPNEATFVCLLSACSHAGLVDEGRHYFDCISQDHTITLTADHCACMVDLLGRAGYLDEAEDFIYKMSIQPDAVVWMALLGACRSHGNVELGRRAFERVLDLEPKHAGAYVLLSNIYAAAGKWYEAAKIREAMEDAGLTKEPGCS